MDVPEYGIFTSRVYPFLRLVGDATVGVRGAVMPSLPDYPTPLCNDDDCSFSRAQSLWGVVTRHLSKGVILVLSVVAHHDMSSRLHT